MVVNVNNPFAPAVPNFPMPTLGELLNNYGSAFKVAAPMATVDPNTALSTVGGWFARGGQPAAPGPAPVDWTLGGNPGVANIIGAESGGNPNARNPRSSAAGLGQFLTSTWNDEDLKKRAGFGKVDPQTWAKLRVGPAGQQAQIAMTQAYAQRNAEQWQEKYGQPPSPGQLYGMHFLDGKGFTQLVDKAGTDPGADASALFPQAATANPEVFYKDPTTRKQPRSAAELVAEITRRGGDTDPWTAPALQQLDPKALAGMMPNPTPPKHINLAPPPLVPDSPDRPQEEAIPVQAWIDKLQQFAPQQFDEKAANEGRIGAVLAGMAKGAAGVDARQGVGAMLAAMGAGAGAVQTAWAQGVKADKKVADDAVRLFELGIARQGLEWEGANKDIRFRNVNRKWEDQRDHVFNQYTNAKNLYDTETRQYLANNAMDNEYGRDVYQASVNRARVALQATEFNVGVTNAQISGQQELDLKRFIFENEKDAKGATDQQLKVVQNMATGIGLNPAMVIQQKEPVGLNALQGMAYIAAKNKPASINALAREMVLAQRWDLLGKGDREKIAALYKQDPELAAAAVGRKLNEAEADPKHKGTTLALAKIMAGSGLPLATSFLQWAHPVQPAQPGAQ